jgi:nitrate reductase alpha subunit
LKTKYKFDSRGTDEFLKISWDDAFAYIARGMQSIAQTYIGTASARQPGRRYAREWLRLTGVAGRAEPAKE